MTARRVLVPGAGSGQSNNLIRGLRAADPGLVIVGIHHDRFTLTQSPADSNFVVPAPGHARLPDALCQLVDRQRIDLLIPTRDWEVALLVSLAPRLRGRLFLPEADVVTLCQDKQRLGAVLEAEGLPVPRTYPITKLDDVGTVFERFPGAATLWCRSRFGADSRAATPVRTPEQARGWIAYWNDIRGLPVDSFTLSEYLPGRDYACQSLWRDGELLLVKTYERLDYLGGYSRPSGVASQSSLAKNVVEPGVVEASARAVRRIAPHASGAFDVDLKARADGTPAITEINAGRFLSSQPIFDFTGVHNMTRVYLQLAFGEPVDLHEVYDAAAGWYMVRDFDALPGIVHEDDVVRAGRADLTA
jgi:predicted ATP-grasp superfamily ATP-dependent carboligase